MYAHYNACFAFPEIENGFILERDNEYYYGDQARVETCVSAGHLLHGAAEELHFFGRYLDRLEKRDGRWKLLYRQVVMDWCKRLAVVDERDSDAFGALSKGAHANDDPLYPFIGSA